jgi:phage shock protein E
MNSNLLIGGLVLLVLLAVFAVARAGQGDAAAAHQKIKAGAKVVDVRSPAEFGMGHWEGAINIPVGDVPKRLAEFGPTNQPIVVYCHSGNRSSRAQKLLQQAGYTDVTNAGGLSDLKKAKQ